MKNFTQVPNWIITDERLSSNAKVLIFYILSKNSIDGWIWRREDILKRTGMSRATYQRARTELIENGLLIDKYPDSRKITFLVNPHLNNGPTYTTRLTSETRSEVRVPDWILRAAKNEASSRDYYDQPFSYQGYRFVLHKNGKRLEALGSPVSLN